MFSQKKPYSAVTVTIERLTSEAVPIDDFSGIPDLVEVVNLQDTGPAEAARAIRKKLKYGNLHRQLRALTLLDGLIQNAGPRFQRSFADEALLERLRFCGTAALSDPEVRKKCSELFAGWAVEYKNTPGMAQVASLYKELPRRKQAVTQERSKVIRETENPFGEDEDDNDNDRAGPSSASHSRSPSGAAKHTSTLTGLPSTYDTRKKKKDRKNKKSKPFNLEAEREQMKSDIAEALIASTNLTNTLQTINRERERISDNALARERFEACKTLRRKILRYIHHVESEQWLGGLLHANDELVTALMTFEQLDRSIDADSDSDDELAQQAHLYRMATEKAKEKSPSSPPPTSPVPALAGLSISSSSSRPPPPPRPSAATKPVMMPQRRVVSDDEEEEEEEEDDENPFADRNAVVRGE
ncbi:hypothetical protein C8A05DRAFT_42199 [Staphylotrichum tortipilum]|uniref:VHS domain-containing protein n=1 Tax=Staphylotrichum tortipilum TaxID=2831512 RepID=A0AAN6MQN8_9PEZI|nr:hypothetical protein C8A05DRAFT_42199 [Staphylotrichum longicolle]